MHHTIQLHCVRTYINFIVLRLTLDENIITLDKKLQLLVLIYACKYNSLLAFGCSDIALIFSYPEKFLSSAG